MAEASTSPSHSCEMFLYGLLSPTNCAHGSTGTSAGTSLKLHLREQETTALHAQPYVAQPVSWFACEQSLS